MAKRSNEDGGSVAAVADDMTDLVVNPQPEVVAVEDAKRELVYFAIGESNLSVQISLEQIGSDGKKVSEAHGFETNFAPYVALDKLTKRGAAQIVALRAKQRKGGRVVELKAAPPAHMIEAFAAELAERIGDAVGDDDNAMAKSAHKIQMKVFDRWIRKFGFK